jgi:hypothetical protein
MSDERLQRQLQHVAGLNQFDELIIKSSTGSKTVQYPVGWRIWKFGWILRESLDGTMKEKWTCFRTNFSKRTVN